MNITINGENRKLSPETTLSTMLDQSNLAAGSFVVELNGVILPQESYTEHTLNENDRVEIIRFVGGG